MNLLILSLKHGVFRLICVLNTSTLIFTLLQNMPNVRDHDASVYLRLQGDALSVGGYEHNPIFWDEVSLTELLTELIKLCVWRYSGPLLK